MADDQNQAIPDNADQGVGPPRTLGGDISSMYDTAPAVGEGMDVSGGNGQMTPQARKNVTTGADIHGYLMGRGAVSDQTWNIMGDAVDPDGQMPPSERNHYIVVAAQQKDPGDLGPSAVEHARLKATQLNAAAASALDQGNLQSATQRATEAHNYVLDGSNTQFQAGNDGMIHATVQPFNGHATNYTMDPAQFREVIHGAHGMWDNMVEQGAGNVINRIVGGGAQQQQSGPSVPSREFAAGTPAGEPKGPDWLQNAAAAQPAGAAAAQKGGAGGGLQKGDVEWVPNGNSGTGFWRARSGTPQAGSSEGTRMYPNPAVTPAQPDHPITVTKFGVSRTVGNATPPSDADESVRRLVQAAYPNDPAQQAQSYLNQRNQVQQLANKLDVSQNRGAAAALIRAQQLSENTDNKVAAEHGRNATTILTQLLKNNPQATLGDLLKTMHDNNIDPNIIASIHKAAMQQVGQQQQQGTPPLQGAPQPPTAQVHPPLVVNGSTYQVGPDGKYHAVGASQ